MLAKTLKISLFVLGICLVTIGILSTWAVGKSLPKKSKLKIISFKNPKPNNKENLSFLTYNIGHCQGVKKNPTDWRDQAYTEQKIEEITQAIKVINADLVALQEVDLNSNRTHYIDQAERIASGANYPYRACALVWDENYVPYPYWPPEFHIGKVQSSNCILSRYPINNHEMHLFEKPIDKPFWYNWAYLERGAQTVEVDYNGQVFTFVNIHLEAFHAETRQIQAKELVELINQIKGPIILAGDFNAVPPEATKKHAFEGDTETDYREDNTIQIIRSNLEKFTESISNQATYPADKPNQRIDAIFGINGIKILTSKVISDTGLASDHLPVWAQVKVQN